MNQEEPTRLAGSWFSRLLTGVFALMFLSFVLWVALGALIARPTQSQAALIEGMSHVCTGCLGTVVGRLS